MTDSSVGIFNKSALPAAQRNRLLGFFYPLCPGFAFHFFNLLPPTDIIHPLIYLEDLFPQVTINLLPYYLPGLYQGSLPPPPQIGAFSPKKYKS